MGVQVCMCVCVYVVCGACVRANGIRKHEQAKGRKIVHVEVSVT